MGGGTPRASVIAASHPDRPPPLSVIPRALSRHSCAGRNPPTPTPAPSPNSSLPPFRGEVRWGVERREHPLSLLHTPIAPHTPIRHTSPLSVIPHPYPSYHAPLRHSCAGRNPPTSTPTPSPNSSLPPLRGGLGGGWNAARIRCRCFTPRSPPRPLPLIPHPYPSYHAPYPSFLRRQEPTHLNTHPLPQFIPPPSQGGG